MGSRCSNLTYEGAPKGRRRQPMCWPVWASFPTSGALTSVWTNTYRCARHYGCSTGKSPALCDGGLAMCEVGSLRVVEWLDVWVALIFGLRKQSRFRRALWIAYMILGQTQNCRSNLESYYMDSVICYWLQKNTLKGWGLVENWYESLRNGSMDVGWLERGLVNDVWLIWSQNWIVFFSMFQKQWWMWIWQNPVWNRFCADQQWSTVTMGSMLIRLINSR